MTNDKKKRSGGGSNPPTIGQIWADLKALRSNFEQLRTTVGKLKDILQVQDNWHSRVSRWIGKEVTLLSDRKESSPTICKLLWTDRYNIGVEVEGRERLYNKGHVVWIEPAAAEQ